MSVLGDADNSKSKSVESVVSTPRTIEIRCNVIRVDLASGNVMVAIPQGQWIHIDILKWREVVTYLISQAHRHQLLSTETCVVQG